MHATLCRYIHDYIWNEAVSWLFVDRRGCADANAQCTADNGGYFYAAQQPAGGHGVIPQEEGVHCPATYGPPAQGADIIPGGPVAPVIPQPPQPPVEDVDPEQPSGSDGAGAGDGTGEQEQEQEQEGEGQLTGNGGDSVPLPTPSPTPAESTDQRLRGAASDSLPQLLQLPAPAKVVSLLAAWGVARAGRQQQ